MPLGTGGALKNAENLIGHVEPFIMLNGDIYADINYRELLEAHKKSGALATIALSKVEDPCSFGVADLEGIAIKRFVEKPPKGQAPSNQINAGAYVLSPEVFTYIPEGKAVSIEREVFPKLAEEGKLCGHCINGLWIDIGKPHEFLEANKAVLDSLAKNAKPENLESYAKNPVAFDTGVFVGENSVIGPYAILGKNVKLPKGCVVGDLAKVKDSIHMHVGQVVCPAKEVTETF